MANRRTLERALVNLVDVQAIVGNATILVRDFDCYDEGMIVKVNGEEPDGINNSYYAVSDVEHDLASVVPGYPIGAAIWQEAEEEEDLF